MVAKCAMTVLKKVIAHFTKLAKGIGDGDARKWSGCLFSLAAIWQPPNAMSLLRSKGQVKYAHNVHELRKDRAMSDEVIKKESTELTTVVNDNEIFALPEEWGFDTPVVLYRTTIDASTEDGKKLLYSALNDEGAAAKTSINKDLVVVGLTFVPAVRNTPEGEQVKIVLMKLSLKDGTIIGTSSKWLMISARSLVMFKKSIPTAKKPWKLQIYAVDAGKTADGEPKQILKIRDLELSRK